jgi:two-component system response regulator AdeR
MSTARPLVLIVEDQREIAAVIEAYLVKNEFRTVVAVDGPTALSHHAMLSPDLLLLDVRIPVLDGFEVLAKIRQTHTTPVILLTAMAEDIDRLTGFRIGADDYIVKPFNPQEVVARVKAVLRRSSGGSNPVLLRCGPIEIDLDAHVVRIHSGDGPVNVQLTLSEYRILVYLSQRPTRVVGRGDLVDACLPESDALPRSVDTHIANLRRKLEASGATGLLQPVRGVGYRLCTPP